MFKKANYANLSFNGYKWVGHDKGIHSFSKKEGSKNAIIQCDEKQLKNGDIEFMTENGITLGKERLKKVQAAYAKKSKPKKTASKS